MADAHPAPRLDDQTAKRIDQHHAGVDEAYEAYTELRERGPVFESERNKGYYILLRHADVRAAALDWKTFTSAKGVALPADRTRPPLPAIEMDPPVHNEWRKRYTDAITPAYLKEAEPKLQQVADRLIDEFVARGHCDLVQELTEPLPVLGICAAIGLEGKKPDEIRRLALNMTSSNAEPEAQRQAMVELGAFILGELYERREQPRNDYLTRIAHMETEGRLLNDQELTAFMIGFLVAGHETTTAAMAGLFHHVIGNAALRQRLLEDDEALGRAIEEAVRLTAPFHGFSRTTTKAVEIGGVTIPEDQVVRLCWASANRDPAVFPDPDRFDIDRERNPHLGFGMGRHVCAGAPFARLEMRIALRTLLTRLPDIALIDEGMGWHFVGGMMTLPNSLRARFTPGR